MGVFIACIVIGLLIALLVVCVLKGQLKTVRWEDQAANYVVDGSFELTESTDLYLYRRVTRTARPKDNKE